MKNKGITLIALVITVVVLVIIGAVAVGLTLGDNGIINRTKSATQEYSNAQEYEKVIAGQVYDQLINASRDSISEDRIREIISETLAPRGSIITQMGNSAPEGYLVCDGSEYEISDYQELADYFEEEYGSAQYFGGEGTKFKVPNLVQRFLKGDTTSGVYQQAGLPNITGFVCNSLWAYQGNGAFYSVSHADSGHNNARGVSGTHEYDTYMNASRSSAIYGRSTTVTPENVSVLYCIKY